LPDLATPMVGIVGEVHMLRGFRKSNQSANGSSEMSEFSTYRLERHL
jgi:hypothetical protein